MNIKYANRKFYNKWLYKVTINLKGGGVFRTYSLDDVVNLCKTGSPRVSFYGTLRDVESNKVNIHRVAKFLIDHKDQKINKRIEGASTDFYTNDYALYKELSDSFADLVIHAFEPLPGCEDIIRDSSKIVAKKLPHNRYMYKVYLAPHKLRGEIEKKEQLLSWIDGQSPRILISPAVKAWFIKTDWNWDRRYLFVEDEQTLLLLKLRCADAVSSVYSYHLVDK